MVGEQRHIALIARDNTPLDLLNWADFNRLTLSRHVLYATGTTGAMLEHELGLHRIVRMHRRTCRPGATWGDGLLA